MCASLLKLPGYTGRLTLLLHLLDWAESSEQTPPRTIEESTVQRAILLVDYFKAQAKKVHCGLAEEEEADEAMALVEIRTLAGHAGIFKKNELYNRLRSRNQKVFNTVVPVKRILERLTSRGVIQKVKDRPETYKVLDRSALL